MKLTVRKSGETVKAIIMEFTPAEALLVNHAMRRYTEDEGVNERNREEVDKMLFTKPTFEEAGRMERIYAWLNDMRLGIAPDETTPEDERGERQAQVDIIDEIMREIEKEEA